MPAKNGTLSWLYFRAFLAHFKWMIRCSLLAVLAAVAFLLDPQTVFAKLAKSTILEGNVGYMRVAETETNLPDEIQLALNDFAVSTNKIVGIVLDLRFTDGADADSLKATEDVLEQAKLPLAILVNRETSGAAASLAYDLRSADAGLVFGSGAPGTATNLQPDMVISASANDEKTFLKNPYGSFVYTNSSSETNLLSLVDIDHTSEADLVREKIKDGEQDVSSESQTDQAPIPYIRDPVLAHGVDFLKGVAALQGNKS
jgi:hypothetical protein